MARLPDAHREAVERLVDRLADRSLDWALTGSASFALQGVPLRPADVDVQTSAAGAELIADLFAAAVVEPVTRSATESLRSHFGVLELAGVRVEVMGDLQKRRPDGTWEPPVDVTDHREFVDLGERQVPVLSLRYEAEAYAQLGRTDRAERLRTHVEDGPG